MSDNKPEWMLPQNGGSQMAEEDVMAEMRQLAIEGMIAVKRFFTVAPNTQDEIKAAEKIFDLVERASKLGIKIDGLK